MTHQQYVGIDIAKKSMDVDLGLSGIRTLENTAVGWQQVVEALRPGVVVIMEATGTYSRGLAQHLHSAGVRLKLINPLSSRRFAQLQLKRTKTDRVDARLLSAYGVIAEEPDYTPPSDAADAAAQHQTVIDQLLKQKVALGNQREALTQLPRPAQEVIEALDKSIKHLETTIKQLRQTQRCAVERGYPGMLALLESVPGIGRISAACLITATEGFGRCATAKQLVAYLGACPTHYDSGTSVHGSGAISRIGQTRVRTLLYMGAMAAIRSANAFQEFYHQLVARGKARKLALIAVVNKMLRVAAAVVRTCTPFRHTAGTFSLAA